MQRPWIPAAAVIFIALVVTVLAMVSSPDDSFRQRQTARELRSRVDALEVLAKEQDATIQALHHYRTKRGHASAGINRHEGADERAVR